MNFKYVDNKWFVKSFTNDNYVNRLIFWDLSRLAIRFKEALGKLGSPVSKT